MQYRLSVTYALGHVQVSVRLMIAQPVNLVRGLVFVFAVAAGLAGCSAHQSAKNVPESTSPVVVIPPSAKAAGARAAGIALRQVGVPYRYGGSTPNGFDCSGLVYYSYSRAGVSVPRTTGQLWAAAHPVARDDLRAGDLLFFSIAGKMSHVGLYLGADQFVHAPSTGKLVAVESLLSDYYNRAFIRGGRPR